MSSTDGGDKRKRQYRGNQGGNKRQKSSHAQAANARGSSGILITCDKYKEKQCTKEALNVFNDAADEFYPVEEVKPEKTEEKETTLEQDLETELKALREDAKKRRTGRFTPLETTIPSVILLQCNDSSIPVVQLVEKLLTKAEKDGEIASRFILRTIPLESIEYASLEAICTAATPLLKREFGDEDKDTKKESIKYAIDIKRRSCNNVKSKEVIDAVAALVPEHHKVDLDNPTITILIEIFRTSFGVSVVHEYQRFKRYNIRSLLNES